jgi:hypothetical protein
MTTKIKSGVIGDNVVGITQLNVSDGTNGQVLITDGAGTLSFSTISGYTDSDVETYLDGGTSTPTFSTATVTGDLTVDTDTFYVDSTNNRVGIGTTSPSAGLLTLSGVDGGNTAGIYFNNTTASTGKSYRLNSGNTGEFMLYDITSSAYRIFVNTSGKVGIGTDSPASLLSLQGDAELLRLDGTANTTRTIFFRNTTSSNPAQIHSDGSLKLRAEDSGTHIEFHTANTERMRIAANNLHLNGGTDARIQLGTGGAGANQVSNNTVHIRGDGADMKFMAASGGIYQFEQNGTEAMRITSNGAIKMPSSVFSQTDKYHLFTNDQGGEFVQILEHKNTSAADGSGPNGMQISFSGVAPNQTNRFFFRCGDTTALRIIIDSQGNITNQNNSYGQISDEKLKENIVDATSKLDGLMQLEIKNFNFIGDDKKQLGVIAQQVETIFPNLIDERKDTHPTTNEDLGTTTKSVKYSVFVPMLIKAMQEQQTIIDDLKSRLDSAGL